MRKYLLIIMIICSCASLRAQIGLFVQQDVMPAHLNPALQGMAAGVSAQAQYGMQWVGLEGAPTLMAIAGAYRYEAHSGGLLVMRDVFGSSDLTGVDLQYAYHHTMGEGTLVAGLGAHWQQQNISVSKLHSNTPGDPVLQENISRSGMDISAGLAFTHPKGYFGISTQNMISEATPTDMFIDPAFTILATGLYIYEVNDLWDIMPGFTYRMADGSPVIVYIQAHARYADKLQADLGYRNAGAYTLGVRWQLAGNIQVGYGYTHDTALQLAQTPGGHEIGLRYGLGLN